MEAPTSNPTKTPTKSPTNAPTEDSDSVEEIGSDESYESDSSDDASWFPELGENRGYDFELNLDDPSWFGLCSIYLAQFLIITMLIVSAGCIIHFFRQSNDGSSEVY